MAVRINFISCRTRSEIRKLVCWNFKCISKESLHNLNEDSLKVANVVLRVSKSLYLKFSVFFVKFLRIWMHIFLEFRKIFVDLKWYLWIICWLSKFLNWQVESSLLYSLRSLLGFVKYSSLLLQLSVISKASFCKKLLLISNPFLKIFWFLKILNFSCISD